MNRVLLLSLGELIVKILVKCKLTGTERDVFTDIITTLSELGIDTYEARKVNRDFEKIADHIAKSCEIVLSKSGLQVERIDAIVENIIFSYNQAELDVKKVLDIQCDEKKIKKIILAANSQYKDNLNGNEIELYERLIEHTSHLITNAYIKLPEFTREGIKRLCIKMDELVEKIDIILEQMEKIDILVEDKSIKISNFERYYRNNVISQNCYVHLFGAGNLRREYKQYPLSIAYVELEICDKKSGKEIKLEKIFEKVNDVWLSGDAGLGKTTLLQWLAVKTAENAEEIIGLRDCIPVMIQLRKYECESISLRDCIMRVMKDSSYEIPEGWIEERINTGRFVFLIDGFDEITENDRDIILNWLKEIDVQDRCKKVFTARPQVKERPETSKLIEVKILPMNRKRIEKFINYWHVAVLDEQLKVNRDDALRIAKELYEKICLSDSLLKLATIPLLCAMICSLHYNNEMNLPKNKRDLYEECCKMLLEKRDEERRIIQDDIQLSYEQKKIILAKLAYWMMKNNHVEIKIEDAEKVIKRSISGMGMLREKNTEQTVFKYLLERCGILRETEKGKIDFLHRTFQEYLAAFDISREEDWGFLIEKIGNTVWQETIGVCIGYANRQVATEIIEKTLEKGVRENEEKKYLFLAIEYLGGAIEVNQEIRNQIENEVAHLIPPSMHEGVELAKAGELVVPYLENQEWYYLDEKIACLQVLRMVGTVKVLEISKTYFNEVLSASEIVELAELYEQFTRKELVEAGIPKLIKTYIENVCMSTVTLHNEFIKILKLSSKGMDVLLSPKIKKLEIIEYDDLDFRNISYSFQNIEALALHGYFAELNILEHMPCLKELALQCLDDKFSVYNLNDYSIIKGIEKLSLIESSTEYINGRDLGFLSNCKCLELIMLNNMSEIEFDYFDDLESLKELRIGAEFAMDLNYLDLSSNIESLTVYVPHDDIANCEQYLSTNSYRLNIEELDEYLKNNVYWGEFD